VLETQQNFRGKCGSQLSGRTHESFLCTARLAA
jgi:hypothetical protein